MVKELLESQLIETNRSGHEHKDRMYPTQSSALIDYKKYKRVQGKCLRAAYYSCLGCTEDSDWNTGQQLTAKLGDYTEKMLLDLLKDKGILKDSQVRFEIAKYNISGKIDAIIEYNGRPVGLEIKSIGGNNKWVTNMIYGSPWGAAYPKWQNLFQTLVYAYAMKETIEEFILMYIRRDTCEIKEFVVSVIPDGDILYPVVDGIVDKRFTVTNILDRYSLLYDYILSESPPPKDFTDIYPRELLPLYYKLGIITKKQLEDYDRSPFGDFECRYCGYKIVCSGDK
jgi:hypothetical protein